VFNLNLIIDCQRGKSQSNSSKKALSSKTIPFPGNKFLQVIGIGIEFHKAHNKSNAFDKANGFSSPAACVVLHYLLPVIIS
jgi:hypothetical protein